MSEKGTIVDRASRPEGTIADIQQGWDVYGSDEQKVGNVAEVYDTYLVARKGLFFWKDLYIPTSAFRRIEHDRVYLNVPKDEVDNQGWDNVPDQQGMMSSAPVRDYEKTEEQPADFERTSDTGRKLELHEEQLQVNKEQVQTGEVRVGKRIVEEQKNIQVPTRREEVYVERVPTEPHRDTHPVGQDDSQTISVPVTEEQVNVEKVPMSTGEVRVGKRGIVENQQVSDTVKREEPEIEKGGQVQEVDQDRTIDR